MTAAPTIVVEVAFTTDPLVVPGALDWTNISIANGVRELTTRRGFQIKTAEIEAGEMTLVLDNRNRALDPSNAASTHWPNVKPRRRIRVKVTPAGGVERILFTGFVERWLIDWNQAATDATVRIEASDLLSLLADNELPPSVLQHTILNPAVATRTVGYWPLGEANGFTAENMVDGRDGSWRQLPQSGPIEMPWDPRPFPVFPFPPVIGDVGQAAIVPFSPSTAYEGTDFQTYHCFFLAPPQPVMESLQTILFSLKENPDPTVGLDPANNIGLFLQVFFAQPGAGNESKLILGGSDRGGFFTSVFISEPDLADGNIHHVAMRIKKTTGTPNSVHVWLDGISRTGDEFTAENIDQIVDTSRALIFGGSSISRSVNVPGQIGHVYLRSGTFSTADVDDDIDAAFDPWVGDTTSARLNRILDIAGVAAGDRDIFTTPAATCSGTLLDRQNFARYANTIAATERALLFVTGAGDITFRRDLSGSTPAVTFSDDGLGVPFERITPDFSVDRIVNSVAISRETGITQTAVNQDSIDEIGRRHLALSTLHQGVSAARQHAVDLVNQQATPRTVITDLTINGRNDDVSAAASLDLEVGDLVLVVATPTGGGAALSQRSLIERVEHSMTQDQQWRVSYALTEEIVVTVPNVQVFTANGTWIKPAQAQSVRVRVVGGGGAGGGAPATVAGEGAIGGGGGGGGYAESTLAATVLGASETVTVGAGGTGVSGGAGNNGSASSLGAHVVAGGGSGGNIASSSPTAGAIEGGAGGVGTTGLIKAGGSAGSLGVRSTSGASGIRGGAGGASVIGGGGLSGVASNGAPGNVYGGGGGGAGNNPSSAAKTGGGGAGGVVIVVTFFS